MEPQDADAFFEPVTLAELKEVIERYQNDDLGPGRMRLQMLLNKKKTTPEQLEQYWNRVQKDKQLMYQLWLIITQEKIRPPIDDPKIKLGGSRWTP